MANNYSFNPADILNSVLNRNQSTNNQQGLLGVNTNFAPQMPQQPSASNIGNQLYTSNMPTATQQNANNSQDQALKNRQLLFANSQMGLLQPNSDYNYGNAAADIFSAIMQRNAGRGGS